MTYQRPLFLARMVILGATLSAVCLGPAAAQGSGAPHSAIKPINEKCRAAHLNSSGDVRAALDKANECTIANAQQAGVLQAASVQTCRDEFAATAELGRPYKVLKCATLRTHGAQMNDRDWRVAVEEVCLALSQIPGHRYQGANRQQCLIDTLLQQRPAPSPARRAECAKDREMQFQCLLNTPR